MTNVTRSYSDTEICDLGLTLLVEAGVVAAGQQSGNLLFERIASDGSTRRFWRVCSKQRTICILCAPDSISKAELLESKAAYFIGRHLREKGCAVPDILGYHEDSGLLLFEDLGNNRLHSVASKTGDAACVRDHYREVIAGLARMQIKGAEGFNPDWCWDTRRYDMSVMTTKESGYFLTAFWNGLLGLETPAGIEEEFQLLATRAGSGCSDFFLHRDFQSRNIMLTDDRPCFIDYQGGRLGPLGYDLASLLIDPYIGLTMGLQEELVEFYLTTVAGYIDIESEQFIEEYRLLALQRNLQIIGAFSFLSRVRQKTFFYQFVKPALASAAHILENPFFVDLEQLKNMVAQGLHRV